MPVMANVSNVRPRETAFRRQWRLQDCGWRLWRSTHVLGEPLTKDRLSGGPTKLAAYRGTSCNADVADYVVRRINGQKIPEVEQAIGALEDMKRVIVPLMQLLGPRDFETLVDLVFSTSGWRRQGIVGKTQKTLDIDLLLPSTGERAFVQVKPKTTTAELQEYVARLDDAGPYDRMFYVFHSGIASTDDESCDRSRTGEAGRHGHGGGLGDVG